MGGGGGGGGGIDSEEAAMCTNQCLEGGQCGGEPMSSGILQRRLAQVQSENKTLKTMLSQQIAFGLCAEEFVKQEGTSTLTCETASSYSSRSIEKESPVLFDSKDGLFGESHVWSDQGGSDLLELSGDSEIGSHRTLPPPPPPPLTLNYGTANLAFSTMKVRQTHEDETIDGVCNYINTHYLVRGHPPSETPATVSSRYKNANKVHVENNKNKVINSLKEVESLNTLECMEWISQLEAEYNNASGSTEVIPDYYTADVLTLKHNIMNHAPEAERKKVFDLLILLKRN
ncbi:hypothetical protein BDR26DRAFT_852520 [Obelidium mucronatum]|nr:hypothetical protein BDR26DRAFT_852520 [Obelidium mucronatum]